MVGKLVEIVEDPGYKPGNMHFIPYVMGYMGRLVNVDVLGDYSMQYIKPKEKGRLLLIHHPSN